MCMLESFNASVTNFSIMLQLRYDFGCQNPACAKSAPSASKRKQGERPEGECSSVSNKITSCLYLSFFLSAICLIVFHLMF